MVIFICKIIFLLIFNLNLINGNLENHFDKNHIEHVEKNIFRRNNNSNENKYFYEMDESKMC